MRYVLLLVAALLVAGCSGGSTSTILLLTDRSEMAAYAEVFNASQRDLKVELVYRSDPAAAVRKGDGGGADVVVAEGLAGRDMREHFRSIGDLLGQGRLDPRGFYPGLLQSGGQDRNQYLLPLSFNLPLLVYDPAALGEDAPPTYLEPDYIRAKSAEFDARKSRIARKVGFSPLWRPEFMYYSAALTGAAFRAGDGRSVQWDEAALEGTLTRFKDWVGSLKTEDLRDFDAKYLHVPFYRLIEDGRILFYLSSTREFLAVPPEKRQSLEFRWLGEKDRIPVTEEIVQAGALRRARNPRGARRFLLWLFQPNTQIQLMETNHFKRLPGVFGIAGGIPALVAVAEKDLPQPHHYPIFVGHIPPRDMLLAPGLLPAGWREARESIVLPWLREAVAAESAPAALRKRLEAAGLR